MRTGPGRHGRPGPSAVGVVVGAPAGQPGGQPLDRHLELRVLVDEGLQLVGQPGEGDLLLAPPVGQLLQAAVGEVHRHSPKAVATSSRCSTSCTLAEPTAGLAEALRLTRRSVRPPRCSGRLTAMNCQAPMLAGSSCTQTRSVAFGYRSIAARICSAGSG